MTFPRGRRARGCGPCSPDTASVAGLVPAPVTAAAARDAPRGPEAPRSLPCVRPEAPRPGRSLLSSPPAPGAPAARGRCGPGDAAAPRPETRPPRARTAFPSRTMPVTPPAGWGPACSSSAPGAEPAPPPARVTSVLRSPARTEAPSCRLLAAHVQAAPRRPRARRLLPGSQAASALRAGVCGHQHWGLSLAGLTYVLATGRGPGAPLR